VFGGFLAGAAVLESGLYRAALACAMAPAAGDSKLFDIVKVADGVFLAVARWQTVLNCNAAIFVNANDVLVVDSHSKPSAAAALANQIRKDITHKPVRYVVNTHFHDDHVRGNSAYKAQGAKVDFIAAGGTRKSMEAATLGRLKANLDSIPQQLDRIRLLVNRAVSAQEKAYWTEQARQFEAFQAEMRNFSLELPTITFEQSHLIRDRDHDLSIEFHGPAHTAADVVVFCPQKRAIATGDMIHDGLPYMPDAYPRFWHKTIDSVARLEFNRILPGHGPVHTTREFMTCLRNYLEELVTRVEEGKQVGKTSQDLQDSLTISTMKSLQAKGYGKHLEARLDEVRTHWGDTYLGSSSEFSLKANTRIVYEHLDRGMGTAPESSS
jgi:glyoxylase-like metal-dependent hydrolase (beta-lactamase superfamily II)